MQIFSRVSWTAETLRDATIVRTVAPDRRRPVRSLVLRFLLCSIIVGAFSLTVPAPVSAHLRSGSLSTDFKASVGTFEPAAPGVGAHVLDGDLRIELRVLPARTVVVLGILGEPFLRFSRAGVEANLASPTATSASVIDKDDSVSLPGVHWHLVRHEHVLAWHDNRLRPVPVVRARSHEAHAVGMWSIPLFVDGRHTTLSGREWHATGPSLWPWLVAGVLLVAIAGFAGRRIPPRRQLLVASLMLPIAVLGLVASWAGVILADSATPASVAFAVVFSGVSVLFLCVVIAAAEGTMRLCVMALVGAFTAAFAAPEATIFKHGFVLSALPGTVVRLAVAAALIGGLSAAAVCGSAVRGLLFATPGSGRRSGHWLAPAEPADHETA